ATIKTALATGSERLAANGVNEPQSESRLLLMHVLHRDRAFLIAHDDDTLSRDQMEQFNSLIARRVGGEPSQYITGHQEFYGLDFDVTPDVLIPRPETELVVESALKFLENMPTAQLADIGTGSGCIVVSLLHELPQARALAVDLSALALEVAQRNAEHHGVKNRLRLLRSDGFSGVERDEQFDLIVSNPPYVSDSEMGKLQREVQTEPAAALAGGPDGFSIIRRWLNDASAHLETGGYYIFEIGFGQGETIRDLIDQRV